MITASAHITICKRCQGSGWVFAIGWTCPKCQGTGEVPR